MVKEFNNLEEIQQYYDEKSNTYLFKEDLVVFNFKLSVKADIKARNINAKDIDATNIISNDIIAKNINAYYISADNINADTIKAKDIDAYDIKANRIKAHTITAFDIIAHNIYAKDISYWAVCSAYHNITCNSIKGRRKNSKHFVLDGKLEVLDND